MIDSKDIGRKKLLALSYPRQLPWIVGELRRCTHGFVPAGTEDGTEIGCRRRGVGALESCRQTLTGDQTGFKKSVKDGIGWQAMP